MRQSFWLPVAWILPCLSTSYALRCGDSISPYTTSASTFRCATVRDQSTSSIIRWPSRDRVTLTRLAADSGGPDLSILISSKDDATQRLAFVSAFAALAVGTNICIGLWQGPGVEILGNDFYEFIRGTAFPISFGVIFLLVGIAHFVFVENFARIVPPKGTWGGLWQVPAPFQVNLGVSYEAYHSYWTGIVEFLGGLWLLAGGLGYTPVESPAFLLFVLTIGVTPANLYMFTHDATPGGAVPRLAYPAGHIARFVVQCGLLSNFWIMAHPS